MGQYTSISSHLFRAILNALTKKGIDIDLLLEKLGISTEIYSDPDYRIDTKLIHRFWEEVTPTINDDYMGLHLGASISMVELGLPGMFFLYSPTIRVALEKMIKYEMLISGFLRMKIVANSLNRERIVLEVDSNHPQIQQVILTQSTLLVRTIDQLAGPNNKPEKVYFSMPYPDDLNRFEEVFGCPIDFDQRINAIEYTPEILKQAIIHRDLKMLDEIESLVKGNFQQLVQKNCLSQRIYKFMRQELYSSNQVPSLSETAQLFNVSGRTLQRKLQQESSSYGQILQSLRKDEAIKLLKENRLNVNEIAWFLGYVEPSSFVMQFKSWTGKSPSFYRL